MEEVLVYVKYDCLNTEGEYEYLLFFSETPDFVWGQDWEINNPASLSDTTPEKSTYSTIYRLKSPLPLKTIQETTCYSLEYATYGIIALSWIDIENLDEYPEFGRMVFHFGDTMDKIMEEVEKYNCKIEKETI